MKEILAVYFCIFFTSAPVVRSLFEGRELDNFSSFRQKHSASTCRMLSEVDVNGTGTSIRRFDRGCRLFYNLRRRSALRYN